MTIIKDDKVWQKLKKNFIQAEQHEGRLGWFPEDRYGSDNGNLPMAYIAMLNEVGHKNGADAVIPGAETPPRPFMRVNLRDDLKRGVNDKEFRKIVEAVAKGESILTPLKIAGTEFQKTLRQVMIDFDDPGNAALTIELKGEDNPLIDSSQLVANVNYKVGKRGVD